MQNAAKTAILYVEDDNITRLMTSRLIGRKFPGVALTLAGNGKEGLDAFMLSRPAIVITDVAMPVLSGFQMVEQILRIAPATCIIVTSGACGSELDFDGLVVQNISFLPKPIDAAKLVSTISHYAEVAASSDVDSPTEPALEKKRICSC
jgi:DNA-binding NtrC family response regulator